MPPHALLTTLALTAGLGFAPAALAAEGFVGVTSDGSLAQFTAQTAPGLTSLRAIDGLPGDARIVALDRLPSGGLVGLDDAGRVYDVDPAAARVAARYGGQPVLGAAAANGPATFTIAVDGASALVVRDGQARRLDLAAGSVTDAALPGGAAQPALDTLPDGRLAGLDPGMGSLVAQAAPGGPLQSIGALPVAIDGPTRVTVPSDGSKAYYVSRLTPRRGAAQSRFFSADTATGAVRNADGPFFGRAFDAIAAVGPKPDVTGNPKVTVTAPRRISLRKLLRDGGVRFTVRSDQTGQVVVSLRDRRGRIGGFGLGRHDVPDTRFSVLARGNRRTLRTIGPRVRLHIAVHGVARGAKAVADRWVTIVR
jgi:hypothetical protein